MSVVKSEYGPTLPELLAPFPRVVRFAAAVAGAIVVAVLASLAIKAKTDGDHAVLVTKPIVFNLAYKSNMHKMDSPGALLSLRRDRGGQVLDTYEVRPLNLPAYRGTASGVLPLYAFDYIRRLQQRYPGFDLFTEGRTRINNGIGYQVVFRARRGARTIFGRHILLVPEDPLTGVRRGVVLEMTSTFGSTPGGVAATGNQGALKTPLRSFRFGRDRSGGEA